MNHSVLIRNVNNIMLAFTQSSIGTFEPLGVNYKTMSASSVQRSLVYHRMCKKWYVPSSANDTKRETLSYQKWIDLENKISFFKYSPTGDERWYCQRASMLLHKWLKPIKKDIIALTGDVEFTKGESFNSARGLTSVRQKLRCLRHWTVTYEAADEAARLCWTTKSLRESAWTHLEKSFYDESANYLWVQNESDMDAFVFLVKTYLFRYVNGARLALVPKDNTIDRAINVEPTFNMLLQRMVGNTIREVLHRLGNNLVKGQHVHFRRLVDERLATIDFSNASDSHILACFEMMFPSWFVDYILKIRSSMTLIKKLDLEVYNFKLSSMGNGFTFEVMTLLLLALARVGDPDSTVYGDDVIITNTAAPSFVGACQSLGWVINNDKTFINSPFRESCGGFYHRDLGYLVSYDFYYCENIVDVITTANKLRLIMEHYNDARLTELYKNVCDSIPASLKGPVCGRKDDNGRSIVEDRFVEYQNFERVHRRNSLLTERFARLTTVRDLVSSNFQDDVIAIVDAFRLKGKVIKDLRFSSSNDTFDLYSAIYGLTTDKKRNSNKSAKMMLYVTRTGNILNASAVKSLTRHGVST